MVCVTRYGIRLCERCAAAVTYPFCSGLKYCSGAFLSFVAGIIVARDPKNTRDAAHERLAEMCLPSLTHHRSAESAEFSSMASLRLSSGANFLEVTQEEIAGGRYWTRTSDLIGVNDAL